MSKIFIADVTTKTVTSDCTLTPSTCTKKDAFWLWARNNKYPEDEIQSSKVGKWMIFPTTDVVDDMWNKVKEAIKDGHLWHAKVSTAEEDKSKKFTHVIIIYTKNFEDVKDVASVLEYLETSGIKPEGKTIYYKTDQQTYAGVYANQPGQKRQKASIYDSVSIKTMTSNTASGIKRNDESEVANISPKKARKAAKPTKNFDFE